MNNVKFAQQIKDLQKFLQQVLQNMPAILFDRIVEIIVLHMVYSFSIEKFPFDFKEIFSQVWTSKLIDKPIIELILNCVKQSRNVF